MKNKSKCEYDSDGVCTSSFFSIIKQQRYSETINIYLNMTCIPDNTDISILTHCLRSASSEDEIIIYINSPGGCMSATAQILNAMNDCKAHITAIADGLVASAATFIFLAANEQQLRENSTCMFHCSWYGGTGDLEKLPNVVSEITFANETFHKLWHKYYQGFFTKKEIDKMLDGTDFWINGDEIKSRLIKKSSYFKKQKRV